MKGIVLSAFPYFLGSDLSPFSKEVPKALSLPDLFNHLEHGFCIAKLQFDSAGILGRENPFSEAFHRKSNRGSS